MRRLIFNVLFSLICGIISYFPFKSVMRMQLSETLLPDLSIHAGALAFFCGFVVYLLLSDSPIVGGRPDK